jgi:hypothetical protein
VLLEVIVSIGLLVFGMAVVGLQVNSGLAAARHTDIKTRALMLIDTKMAELDSGVIRPEGIDDILEGDFGLIYPGYAWRMRFDTTETDDLIMVTLEVGYDEAIAKYQIESGNQEYEIEFEETRVIQTAYRLVTTPAKVDLERDFGFTEEEIAKFAEQVPIPGFDPSDIDPTMIAQLDASMLEEFLPFLEQLLGSEQYLKALSQFGGEEGLQRLAGQGRGRGRGSNGNDGVDTGAGGEMMDSLREEYDEDDIEDAIERVERRNALTGETQGFSEQDIRDELERRGARSSNRRSGR